jgi:hypothetical protein
VEAIEKRVLLSAGGGFSGAGITGSYYANTALTGSAAFTRVDDRVDFNFGTNGAPGGTTDPSFAVGASNWSAKWVGMVIPRYSEAYTIAVTSEGADRLYFNGTQVISNFTQHTSATDTFTTVKLTAGQSYSIELDYATTFAPSSTTPSLVRLHWSSASTADEDIEPAAPVGLNVDGGEGLLANLVNAGTRPYYWLPGNTSGYVLADSNQWPTGDFEFFIGEGDVAMESGGTYLIQFKGTAAISQLGQNASFHVGATNYGGTLPDGAGYNSSTGLTTATLVIASPANAGDYLVFTNTSREDNTTTPQHDGITNLYVMQPTTLGGNTDYTPGTLFTNAALTQLSHYSTLRAMGLTDTNGNLATNWSDRTLVNNQIWNGWTVNAGTGVTTGTNGGYGTGLPWEVVVALANETGKDLYINIPSNASLDYINKLADLIAYGSDGVNPYTSPQANPVWAPLNSNLKVYIEYSNEIWNYGFTQAGTGGNGWINQLAQRALYDYVTNNQNDPLYPGGGNSAYLDGQAIAPLYLPGGAGDPGAAAFEATYNANGTWPGYGSPEYFSNGDSALPGYTVYQGWAGLRLEQISTAFKNVLGETSVNADSTSSRVRPVFEWQYGGAWDGELAAMQTLFGATHRVGYYLYGGGGGWYSDDTYNGFADSPFTNGNFTTPVVSTGSSLADPAGSGWTFNNGTIGGSTAGITTNGSDLLSTFNQGIPNLGPDNNPSTNGQAAYLQPGASISQSVTFSGGWADITLIAGQSGQGGDYYHGLNISVDGTPLGESEGAVSFSGSENSWTWDRTAAFNVSAGTHTITFTNSWNAGSGATVFIATLGIQTVNGLFNETAAIGAPLPGGGSIPSDVKVCQQYGLFDVGYEGGFDFNQNLDNGDNNGQAVYQDPNTHLTTDAYAEMGSKGYSSGTPNVAAEANLDPRTVSLAENTINQFYAAGGTLPIAFEGYGNVNSWAIAAPTYYDTNTPKQQAANTIEQALPVATTFPSTVVPNTIYPAYKNQDSNDFNGSLQSGGLIDWSITVPVTGTYTFTATTTTGGSYRLSINDVTTLGTGTSGGTINPSITLYPGEYIFKVEATSGSFTVSQVVISEAGAPASPVLTSAALSNSGVISLSWNSSGGATGYLVGYGPTAGQYTTFIDEGNTLSGTVTVPNPALVYHVAVYAYNSSLARSLPSAEARLALRSSDPGSVVNFSDQPANDGYATHATEPLVDGSFAFTSFGNAGGQGLFVIDSGNGYYPLPTKGLDGGYWGTSQQITSATAGHTFDLYSLDLFDFQAGSAVITGTDISGGTLTQIVNFGLPATYASSHQVLDWTDLTTVQVTWWDGLNGGTNGRNGAISNLVFNDLPPAITSAIANPGTVTGVSTTLTASATDPKNPVSSLIYTWAATTVPAGAAAPLFTSNNTNSAQNTTAYFTAAGNYVFTVTATDASGLVATQTVPVTVQRTASGVLQPVPLQVADNGSVTLPAPIVGDQFGIAMGTQPARTVFTWQLGNGSAGHVNSFGKFFAPVSPAAASWNYVVITGGGYSTTQAIYTAPTLGPNYYSNFSGGAIAVNGNAAVNSSNGRLDLTTGGGQAGSAWYGSPLSTGSFVTDFAFQISTQPGDYAGGMGGDGITFTIQNQATTALGSNDTGLGYQGISNSVALKFDLQPWDANWNSSAGVGNEELDSIGLFTNGAAPTAPATDLSLTNVQLRSGDVFQAHVTYNGSNLSVTLVDMTAVQHWSATESYPVNLASVIGSSAAYFGFTAGSGGNVPANSFQDILWWTYGQPQTVVVPVANQSGGLANLTIDSTRPLTGFNQSSVSLTLNGNPVSLNTATISTNNGGLSYTLGNLTGLTSTSGTYVLSTNASNITDVGGNNPAASASATWTTTVVGGPLNLTGSNYLEVDGTTAGQLDVWAGTTNTGSPTSTYQLGQITTITDAGTIGNDTLTIKFANGNPLAAGTAGVNFDNTGATGGADSVILIGDNHGDTYTASAGQILVSGGSGASAFTAVPVTFANVTNESVLAGTGPDALSVSGGVTLGYTAPTGGTYPTAQLSSIAIGSACKVIFSSPNSTRALLELNTAATWAGQLNLQSNDMLIHGGTAAYNTVNGLVITGYSNGTWTGTGIISSTAATSTTHLTALGTVLNTAGIAFDGVSALGTDVLVKYTYYGDANLGGSVVSSDYTRIDNGYLNHLAGWGNGDFNYDGVINGSDYTLIDNAFNTQGASLAAVIAAPDEARVSPRVQSSSFAANIFRDGSPISPADPTNDIIELLIQKQDILDRLTLEN